MTTAAHDFAKGQAVHYPGAPDGIAQVDDVLRTNVDIIWAAKSGRIRRRRINAYALKQIQDDNARKAPLLPCVINPLGRGVRGGN